MTNREPRGNATIDRVVYDRMNPAERMDAWHVLMRKAGLDPDSTIAMPFDAGQFEVGMNFLDLRAFDAPADKENPA